MELLLEVSSLVVFLFALYSLGKAVKRRIFWIHAIRETGEVRRRLAPPHVDLVESYFTTPGYSLTMWQSPAAKALHCQRGFFKLRGGEAIFYQTWLPPEGAAGVNAVVIFVHGYTNHHESTGGALPAKIICALGKGRIGAVGFDMPCHGRSDGLYDYIPDFFAFIRQNHEIIAEHILPLVESWRRDIKVFGFGSSLGGGVLFSILAQEKALLSGAVLVCPMLYVSEELYPPKPVVWFFKHVLLKLMPTWPVTPSKDLVDFFFTDPECLEHELASPKEALPIIRGQRPRVTTAYALAFGPGPKWMMSMIPSYDTPTLIIHSADDKVTDPHVSTALFEGMACVDKEYLKPTGLAHMDLLSGGAKFYDDNRERYEHITQWIERHC
eukprot:NODE_9210_length_1439_cov_8.812500.p1 GENE.NODE_9210_length_1439_cov_8.812500~~NODE_9210_length_1439_cov_8.812500.p1  ORF type:complete len:382 (-),score=93.98 NODE_9210_length_1439_cov_8.812500:118-1263(-)